MSRRPTGEAVEQLCGCRSANGPGANIYRHCREAQALLKCRGTSDDYAVLATLTEEEWDAYRQHLDGTENPVVRRQGRDGVWRDVE